MSLTTTFAIEGFRARISTIARGQVGGRVQVFDAERMRHAFLGEDPPRAALAAQPRVLRVRAVHRDAERQGEIALERRRVERHQVRAVEVGNQRADLLESAADVPAASAVSGRDDPSSGDTRNRRFFAWLASTPGSRSR